MLKKCLVFFLIAVMCNLAMGATLTEINRETKKTQESVEKIKAKIAKIGTGEKAKLKVEMLDKTKIKGYVSKIEDDSFTVTESNSGANTKIAYNQVKKISGSGLSMGAKIGIGVLVGVGITVTAIFLKIYCNEQAC